MNNIDSSEVQDKDINQTEKDNMVEEDNKSDSYVNTTAEDAGKPGFFDEIGMKAMVLQTGGSLKAMQVEKTPEEKRKEERKKILGLLFAALVFTGVVTVALSFKLFDGFSFAVSDENATLFIVAALCGAFFMGCVAPFFSSKVLERKRRKRDKWFDDELDHLQKKLAMDYTYKPNRKDPGADGALGIWFDDCVARDKMRKLSRDQVERLKQTGLFEPAYSMEDYLTAEELVAISERSVSKRELVMLALVAAGYTPFLISTNDVAASCFVGAMLVMLTTLAFCDQKSRLLPLELTSALLPLAMVCAYFRGGIELLGFGCLIALICFVVLYAINWVSNTVFHKPSIGKGDVKLIPVCALPLGVWPGLFGALVMSLTMIVYATYKAIKDTSVGKGTKFPMGWFIMLGFAAGCVVPL